MGFPPKFALSEGHRQILGAVRFWRLANAASAGKDWLGRRAWSAEHRSCPAPGSRSWGSRTDTSAPVRHALPRHGYGLRPGCSASSPPALSFAPYIDARPRHPGFPKRPNARRPGDNHSPGPLGLPILLRPATGPRLDGPVFSPPCSHRMVRFQGKERSSSSARVICPDILSPLCIVDAYQYTTTPGDKFLNFESVQYGVQIGFVIEQRSACTLLSRSSAICRGKHCARTNPDPPR